MSSAWFALIAAAGTIPRSPPRENIARMWRPNYARAAALCLGACCALLCAPVHAGRLVQDGVLQDGVPAASAQLSAGMARFGSGSEARLLDWLSDNGSLLVTTREGGREQLQRWSGEPPRPQALGAPAAQLRAAAAQPFHNDWVAALASSPEAAGGDDAALWLDALDGVAASCWWKARASGRSSGRTMAGGSPSAPRCARGRRLRSLHSRYGRSAGPRLVASGAAGAWQVLAWTSADRSLLVRHTVSGGGDQLLLVDVDTGAMRRVDAQPAATTEEARIGEARLASDDRGVYLSPIAAAITTGCSTSICTPTAQPSCPPTSATALAISTSAPMATLSPSAGTIQVTTASRCSTARPASSTRSRTCRPAT